MTLDYTSSLCAPSGCTTHTDALIADAHSGPCQHAEAQRLGAVNAETAIDQADAYGGLYSAQAAYLVNTVDTAREYGVSAEVAVQQFLETFATA